jgi:hypothetical protein
MGVENLQQYRPSIIENCVGPQYKERPLQTMHEPDWNQIHRQLSHGISAPEILSHRVFGRQRPDRFGTLKSWQYFEENKIKKPEVCGITLLQSVSIHSISIAKWEGDRLWECTRPARHQAQHSSRRRAALAALPSSCVCGALAPSCVQAAATADSLESRLEFFRAPQGHPSRCTPLLYEKWVRTLLLSMGGVLIGRQLKLF